MYDQLQPEQQKELSERLQSLGQRLQSQADAQVGQRLQLEARWLADTRQFNGEYEPDEKARMERSGGSKAFVNLTRVKCNIAEARLSEMLLPTDDRNWSIQPTPIPDLTNLSQIGVMPNGQPVTAKDIALQKMSQAQDACQKMQRQMDDQLEECAYNAVLRDVLHDSVVYGTGILKGVVVLNNVRHKWAQVNDGFGNVTYVVEVEQVLKPTAERVNPWDFFPDMKARKIDECEFIFHRHRMSRKDLRALAKNPTFLKDNINELLSQDPSRTTSGRINEVVSDDLKNRLNEHYEVWEYHGTLDKKDLEAAGFELNQDDNISELSAIVWFCNGIVIKAVQNPIDTGDMPFSVFNWERDDTSVFGFGIPYTMRHSQQVANAAWRMVIDNARMSVSPQIVVNDRIIQPIDGNWQIRPSKIWRVTDPQTPVNAAFGTFPIMSNMNDLMGIFNTTRTLIDEETNLPMLARGEGNDPAVTQTATGASIMMNSASTVLRRLVKEFDDNITRPFIKRLYDWNMQFNDDESIKGDYDVIALGSSSLMVREQQTQGLHNLLQLAASSPILMPMTKIPDLYRKLVQSMQINADGLIKSDEEIKAEQQSQQGQQQQDPKMMELQLKQQEMQQQAQIKQVELQIEQQRMQAEEQRNQATLQLEQQRLAGEAAALQAERDALQQKIQLEVLKIAAQERMTVEEVQSRLNMTKMNIDSKHSLFNAETQIKLATGSGL